MKFFGKSTNGEKLGEKNQLVVIYDQLNFSRMDVRLSRVLLISEEVYCICANFRYYYFIVK